MTDTLEHIGKGVACIVAAVIVAFRVMHGPWYLTDTDYILAGGLAAWLVPMGMVYIGLAVYRCHGPND